MSSHTDGRLRLIREPSQGMGKPQRCAADSVTWKEPDRRNRRSAAGDIQLCLDLAASEQACRYSFDRSVEVGKGRLGNRPRPQLRCERQGMLLHRRFHSFKPSRCRTDPAAQLPFPHPQPKRSSRKRRWDTAIVRPQGWMSGKRLFQVPVPSASMPRVPDQAGDRATG